MAADSSDVVLIRLANTGLKKEAIKTLPIVIYTSASKLPPGLASDCPICLAEFGEGEQVRVLPNCNHCFHMECIDKWLTSHSSCPMCRHSLSLLNRNRKPEGAAAITQATESNNVIHVVTESIDSTQAIPSRSEMLEITRQEETGVTTSSQ
jgi:E3 ubiquitin-protein ligase ATL10/75/76/77/78